MSTEHVFPAGLYPDVLSVDGYTYCAYVMTGRGLSMLYWPDGAPGLATELWFDPLATTKGYARLTFVNGQLLVADHQDYGRTSTGGIVPELGVIVADGQTGAQVSPWKLPFDGNNPVTWGPSGSIAVQGSDQAVRWSTFPAHPLFVPPYARQGAATGLSRFAGDTVRLVAEDDFLIPGCRIPMWANDSTIVGVGQNGGVAVVLPSETHVRYFRPEYEQFDARGTRQRNGRLTFAWWDRDGASMTVAADVADAELIDPSAPEPLPEDFTVRAFPRKVWTAPFYEVSAQYGVSPAPLGNAIMIVAPGDVPLCPTDRPRIVSSSAYDATWANITVAYWASGADISALEAAVRQFPASPEKPTIAYLDSDNWPVNKPTWVGEKVWPSVQCYRGFSETILAFKARCEATLDRVASYGKPMGLTPGFYDRRSLQGQLSLEMIEECLPLYEEWMQRYPIVAFTPFSDRRPGGFNTYPTLREWCRKFCLANPVRPNRYDWWTPSGVPLKDSLKNKLSQTVELISLTKTEKDFLLGKLQ